MRATGPNMTPDEFRAAGASARRSHRRAHGAHAGWPGEAGRNRRRRAAGARRPSAGCLTREPTRSALLDDRGRSAVRSLALQRASAVLRLHHVEPGADRSARRPAGERGESELRLMDPVADGHGDRGADGAMDCRAHRVCGLTEPSGDLSAKREREGGSAEAADCS